MISGAWLLLVGVHEDAGLLGATQDVAAPDASGINHDQELTSEHSDGIAGYASFRPGSTRQIPA